MDYLIRSCGLLGLLAAFGCGVSTEDVSPQPHALTQGAAQAHGRPKDWPMSTYDVSGNAHNTSENILSPTNVGQLEVRWEFDEAVAGQPVAPIHAMPVVANGRTYVGSYAGRFYAISEEGHELWHFDTYGGASIVGAAVLPSTEQSVIFGDTAGVLYKLDRQSGALLWSEDIDTSPAPYIGDNPWGGIVGNSLLLVGDTVVAGLSSSEAYATVLAPAWPCCTHRGAVVAIAVDDGEERWRYEAIDPADQGFLPAAYAPEVYGPSGADVWGQPTYDPETNIVYFTTGQNFTRKPDGGTSGTTDAIGALDADTGELIWIQQMSVDDIWRLDMTTPDATGRFFDEDIGDSPKIYRLADGTKVVAAGQKNGAVHVLDASTGAPITSRPVIDQASALGGFQTGGAFADGTLFLHGLHRLSWTPVNGVLPFNGVVVALSADGDTLKWQRNFLFSALAGPISVANGIVFMQSPRDEPPVPGLPMTWGLWALDAGNGATLAHLSFPGRALNGPVVSNGRVYAGTGNAVIGQLGVDSTGSVLCLGLPED